MGKAAITLFLCLFLLGVGTYPKPKFPIWHFPKALSKPDKQGWYKAIGDRKCKKIWEGYTYCESKM